MLGEELHPIRRDVIFEAVAQAHGSVQIELIELLLPGPEKVMEDSQPLIGVQNFGPAVQASQILGQVRIYPVEEGPGFFRTFAGHGDRDVLVLNEVVAGRRLLREHPVIFPAVLVQIIPALPHQNTVLEVGAVEAAVVDGDFGHGVGGQAVENTTVGRKHVPLILIGGQGVVNVGKAPGLAVLAVDLPDPIPVDALDGDRLLNAPGYLKPGPFTPVCRG